MRLLLIDNYDSYTYNLAQLIAGVTGVEPLVLCNDDPAYSALDLKEFGAIVISPGPGHPGVARDFGCSAHVCRQRQLPVLGVCLGHQGLALAAGARISPAPWPRHGHLSRIAHVGDGLFAGIPQHFTAVRYHSLRVQEPLPPELMGLAWAEDGVLMALRHRTLPLFGVQFHPESICTEHGDRLLRNFLGQQGPTSVQPPVPAIPDLAMRPPRPPKAPCKNNWAISRRAERRSRGAAAKAYPRYFEPAQHSKRRSEQAKSPSYFCTAPKSRSASHAPLRLLYRVLPRAVSLEQLYTHRYRHREHVFWLDSARAGPDGGRFSFLGSASAPDGGAGEVLSYRCGEGHVRVLRGDVRRVERGTLWSVLGQRLVRGVQGAARLPFNMCGGYVGYFGYELKAELGGAAHHRAAQPDAMFIQASRFIAVDHLAEQTYVVALSEPGTLSRARGWIEKYSGLLMGLAPSEVGLEISPAKTDRPALAALAAQEKKRYCAAVVRAQNYLREGESYEVCLSRRFRFAGPADELGHYLRLRRENPAPYAALIRVPGLSIHSASPECFLRVDREGRVHSRPIKGTAARDPDPARDDQNRLRLASDAKTRAENLMICDLLRNDLGRVCRMGSVHVPSFMAVETYATVHQLVTTVAGRLRPKLRALDAVRACFPGGSMTGAPKLRTMEIIDQLEADARGIYAGSLGYLTFDGAAELSIVIRAAVRCGDEWTVGAGGAVVLASEPEAEYEEMLLKARVAAQGLARPHT